LTVLSIDEREVNEWYESAGMFGWKANDVAYRDYGGGQPMLLIHGFPTAGCDWSAIGATLSRNFRLVAPDLLDYGRSRNPARTTWHIHDQADMIEALLKDREITECDIVAHDVGDTVAQELLARHDEGSLDFRLRSLILMNGGIFPGHHRARTIQKLLLSPIGPLIAAMARKKRFMNTLAAIFGPNTRPDSTTTDLLWTIAIGVNGKQSLARRIRYMQDRLDNEGRWVGALKNTSVRMMMINGVMDPISGGHVCDVIEEEVPQMKIVRLENIGHFPPLEAAEQCTQSILAFHAETEN